jgi:hypothetical protein
MVFVSLLLSVSVFLHHKHQVKIRNRPAATITGKYLSPSFQSKAELIAFMKREENIVGLSVVSISLVTNERNVTFFESEIPAFTAAWDKYLATRTSIPPVFTQNYYQNTRITEIINGNFECRLTKATLIGTLYPADKYAPWVCSIAVPPAFDDSGDFLGYLNFFLKGPISDSEKARLAKEAIILSNNIYRRDIAKG